MAPSRFRVAERTSRLEFPAETVWQWHTRPGAFERLTPPWERTQVVSRSGGIEDGARVELRLRAGLVPVRWVAVHRGVVPGREFRDEQVEGPFEHWVHLHRIEPDGPDACVYTDRIEYLPPFGVVGAAADQLFVHEQLERMLAYRHATLADDLASHHRWRGAGPLTIAITGSSGMIGSALVPFLETGGHRVRRVVRRTPSGDEIGWNPEAGTLAARALDGVDAVIHLAGENIAARRWTAERKRRLLSSRASGTRTLAEAIARADQPPAVLVSASAIGVYGDRGDEVLDEQSPAGKGFLADLCRQWERATEAARDAGVRVVTPRLGVVLTPAGGALGRMLPAFRAGGGARLGGGRQWMSLVSIDDVLGAIHHLAMHGAVIGPANVVCPEPVRNADFTAQLGAALGRPAALAVPAAALRLAFGELANESLLASQRVVPARLEAAEYRFRHPTPGAALAHVLGSGRGNRRRST
jgi:hypothetical protein